MVGEAQISRTQKIHPTKTNCRQDQTKTLEPQDRADDSWVESMARAHNSAQRMILYSAFVKQSAVTDKGANPKVIRSRIRSETDVTY